MIQLFNKGFVSKFLRVEITKTEKILLFEI